MHGANLIRQLRRLAPDIECVGYGGPKMAAAGCRAAMELGAGSPIWELARSEQAYTFQRPGEYITSVLAGAIHAGPYTLEVPPLAIGYYE